MLSVNQLLHACLLTKWKKCNILSLFLQIHIVESTIPRRSSVPLSLQKGAAYGMLPICKAFVCLPFYKRSFHIPLQSPWGCITLWASAHTDLKITTPLSLTCESSDSHRQQTKFAAFILSLQNGKCFVCFPSYSFRILVFYADEKVPHVTVIPILWHTAFYFPPLAAGKERAVNSMEIKDFIIL